MIDPRGYVLIHVGKGHPLSDVRGYAYEHRLVAQQSINRALESSDLVHHENERKGDNIPMNLVLTDRHQHGAEHRKPGSRLRKHGEDNPIVACACGCGARLHKYDRQNRPRHFIGGHNVKRGAGGHWEALV